MHDRLFVYQISAWPREAFTGRGCSPAHTDTKIIPWNFLFCIHTKMGQKKIPNDKEKGFLWRVIDFMVILLKSRKWKWHQGLLGAIQHMWESLPKFYKDGSEQLANSKFPICRLDGCSDFVLQCKIEVVFTPGENPSHAAPNSLQDRAHDFYLFMTSIIQDNKRKQCQHTPCWALLEASGFPLNFLCGHVCHLMSAKRHLPLSR